MKLLLEIGVLVEKMSAMLKELASCRTVYERKSPWVHDDEGGDRGVFRVRDVRAGIEGVMEETPMLAIAKGIGGTFLEDWDFVEDSGRY